LEAAVDLPEGVGKRVGLLGGTFDPVHNGHLAAASIVRKEFHLDSVVFIPSASPPHKPQYHISDFRDRLAMLQKAAAGQTGFFVSDLEGVRSGPSYTIDTLKNLHQTFGDSKQFYFIIGIDAFADIGTWKQYDQLLYFAHFVVLDRPGSGDKKLAAVISRFFQGFRWDDEQHCWIDMQHAGVIHYLAMEPVDVSSTRIRKFVKEGRDVADMVPMEVAKYIVEHNLYQIQHA